MIVEGTAGGFAQKESMQDHPVLSDYPCPKCRCPLRTLRPGGFQEIDCPGCKSHLSVQIFPKRSRVNKMLSVEAPAGMACFFHEDRAAETSCSSCGRMLCPLCDLEIGDRHLCANCLDQERRKPKTVKLESRRVAWDQLSVLLAILPLFMWPISLITGPATVGLAIHGWRQPASLVSPRSSRAFLIVAMLLGAGETLAWGVFWIFPMFANLLRL